MRVKESAIETNKEQFTAVAKEDSIEAARNERMKFVNSTQIWSTSDLLAKKMRKW